ncbi:MAG TPA: cytochrome c [Myxococcota bacterium]|nr:cytochrome c [Myxococcota bacterium]
MFLFALLSTALAEDLPGKAVYTQFCVTCHGPEGDGGGPAGAALDPKPANFTEASFWEGRDEAHLKKVVTEGGASVGVSPLMIAWGGVLSEEQITQVVAYVQSFEPAESTP